MNKDQIIAELKPIIAAKDCRAKLIEYITKLQDGEYREQQRTYSQNRALHLFCRLLAEALNDAGYNVQLVLKEKVDIDWTPQLVKEILWRTAQQAILGKTSTKELSKLEDIDKVYDHLSRHLGEKFGLEIPPFPSDPNPAPEK